MADQVRKSRIEEIGDESRRRILDAAEELFAEKGFSRTSFVDIAERSGISRGSIPWHFENKDGLLTAVVERAIERYVPQGTIKSFDADGLRDVFERLKEWSRDPSSAMIFMILTEALSSDGPVHQHYVDFFREARQNTASLLVVTGGEERPSRKDLERLIPMAAVVHGAVLGLTLQHGLDPEMDISAALDALESMVEMMINPS